MKRAKSWISDNKRTSIIIAGVIILIIVFVRHPRNRNRTLTPTFASREYVVQTGDLQTTLTLQWTTTFADSQKLTFINKGKITAVNVKVGESVYKWQVLAAISTDDLDTQVEQAQLNLSDAQMALSDATAGYDLKIELALSQAKYDEILLKQKTINQDQALELSQLNQTIEKDKVTISEKQKSYDDVLADYNELLSGSESATADLALSSTMRDRNAKFQDAVYKLKTSLNSIKTTLDWYDQIVGVTMRYSSSNQDKIYIWAKDLSTKEQSEKTFQSLNELTTQLEKVYWDLESTPIADISKEELLSAYIILKNIGSDMMIWWENNYTMFKSSVDTIAQPQSKLDSYAKTYGTDTQSAGIQYIQSYTNTVDILAKLDDDTSLPDKKRELDNAKIALQQAETQLEKDQLSISSLLVSQQKEKADLLQNLANIQRDIAKIKGWESLNQSKINQAKNSVRQKQESLNALLKKYDDYLLEANFDGVITQMDMQMWDNIESNSDKYIYVENNNVLEMVLNVEQVDIIKLKAWMDVVVFLDAYSTQEYHGIITEINTIPTSAGGIATYEVTVTFEKNDPDEVILAGMWWNAKIITSQTKNVLLVPNQSITRSWDDNIVSLYKNWQRIDQIVKIWDSDENNTQITEGLSISDKIKAIYITQYGLSQAGISTEKEELDIEAMQQQNMQNNVQQFNANNSNRWWGQAGGRVSTSTIRM